MGTKESFSRLIADKVGNHREKALSATPKHND